MSTLVMVLQVLKVVLVQFTLVFEASRSESSERLEFCFQPRILVDSS